MSEIKYKVTPENDLMQIIDGREVGKLGVFLAPDTAELFASAPEMSEWIITMADEEFGPFPVQTVAEAQAAISDGLFAQRQRVAELEAECERARDEAETLRPLVTDYEGAIAVLKDEPKRLRSEIDTLRARVTKLKRDAAKLCELEQIRSAERNHALDQRDTLESRVAELEAKRERVREWCDRDDKSESRRLREIRAITGSDGGDIPGRRDDE